MIMIILTYYESVRLKNHQYHHSYKTSASLLCKQKNITLGPYDSISVS